MTIKERAINFYSNHKKAIWFVVTVLGIGGLYLYTKSAEQNSQEEMDRSMDEAIGQLHEMLDEEQETRRVTESKPTNEPDMSEADRKWKNMETDPDRQLACGGWVLENDMRNTDLPMMIANDVPVSALGEFGQEMIKKAEGADLGKFNQDLQKARIAIMANLQTPEEESGNDQPHGTRIGEKEETANEQGQAA